MGEGHMQVPLAARWTGAIGLVRHQFYRSSA
jgi:hypothetical protein